MPVDDHHPEIAAAARSDPDTELGPYLRPNNHDLHHDPADQHDDCGCDDPEDCECNSSPDDDWEIVRLRHDPTRGLDVLRLDSVPRTVVEGDHTELSFHRPTLALIRDKIGTWLEAATLNDLKAAGFNVTRTSGPPLTITGNYTTLHRLNDAGLTDPRGLTPAGYRVNPDANLPDGELHIGPMP